MPDLDLFGEPLDPRRGLAGRPRHMPTESQRAKVRMLMAEGKCQLAIAQALGITVPTLVLNYPTELNSRSEAASKRAARERSKS
nr:hypothetical protein [Novosphingobium panipatense]